MVVKKINLPLAVEIEINHDCNQRCGYCPNSKYKRVESGRMHPALFDRIIGQLLEVGYTGRVSYHFYSEPLLSPDLENFLSLTKERLPRCRVELYTNGTLLNEKRLSRLLELGVDKFTVTKHVHSDVSEFEHAYSKLSEAEKRKVRYTPYKSLVFTNRGGSMGGVGRKDPTPINLPCHIPCCTMVVTVNGTVLPCFEDFFQRNPMGNVREGHVLEIWNSARYTHFRKELKKGLRADFPTCRDCNNPLIIC